MKSSDRNPQPEQRARLTAARPPEQPELRARLATAQLPEPAPDRVQRWQATLRRLPSPAAHRYWRRAAPLTNAGLVAAAITAVVILGIPSATQPANPRLNQPAVHQPVGQPGPATQPLDRPGAAPIPATDVPAANPPALTRGQLSSATPSGHDYGPLGDPATRRACLVRLGVTGAPLAGRQVVLDGHPGVLMVLPGEHAGRLRLLVVDPACARILADDLIGH